METFTCIGDVTPSIGIHGLTPQHCQSITALLPHTAQPSANTARKELLQAFKEARTVDVSIVTRIQKSIRRVPAEQFFPELSLQDLGYHESDPSRIVVPDRCTQVRATTWKYRTLTKHIFLDRLYECSDAELADERSILVLTLGRCRDILGLGDTFCHDRDVLLALYAAACQLEAEMRGDHPRFRAHVTGTRLVNRHRLRFYTSALAFFKVHIENLLQAEMPQPV